MRTQIYSSSGAVIEPKEGGSCQITVTLYDASGNALTKAEISTLTVSLYNAEDNAIINSRNAQSVLDANGGLVSSGGVLTLALLPSDNIIVDSTMEKETHNLDVNWTWTDINGLTWTEKELFFFRVINVPTPLSSPTNPDPGWPS